MNNRNWIAVFLGLACLVLFVSVMGASGNWLNGNNNNTNNGATPQQINQTVRDMDNNTAPKDGNMPTEIDADTLTEDITGTNNNNNGNNNNAANNQNTNNQSMPKISIPQITQ